MGKGTMLQTMESEEIEQWWVNGIPNGILIGLPKRDDPGEPAHINTLIHQPINQQKLAALKSRIHTGSFYFEVPNSGLKQHEDHYRQKHRFDYFSTDTRQWFMAPINSTINSIP